MNIKYILLDKPADKRQKVESLLYAIESDFVPVLGSKVDLSSYSFKLATKSTIIFAYDTSKRKLAGMLAFYCNDYFSKESYISIFGIMPSYRGNGIGKMLLDLCIDHVKELNFKKVKVETWSKSRILKTYQSMGFQVTEMIADRPDNNFTVKLELKL